MGIRVDSLSVLAPYIMTAHEISRRSISTSPHPPPHFPLSMEDSGDADFLSAEAPADPAVVAAALALCSFRPASPPDEPAPSPAAVDLPPVWRCHAPRTERRMRRLSNSKEAVASRRRQSPMTPLEHRGRSGASESCSEEILMKRGMLTGPETKVVVAGQPELSVFRIPDSKPITWSSAKKKLMLPELEAMHQSLLEHRKFLLKELEAKRRSKVVLLAKNQELMKIKKRSEPRKRPNSTPMPEEVHPKGVRLPDLNISLALESD